MRITTCSITTVGFPMPRFGWLELAREERTTFLHSTLVSYPCFVVLSWHIQLEQKMILDRSIDRAVRPCGQTCILLCRHACFRILGSQMHSHAVDPQLCKPDTWSAHLRASLPEACCDLIMVGNLPTKRTHQT